tara:strand:- start:1980 stop:2867 length:888 start_codon:yes stop_codon:yes gene_type:complete
MKTELLRGAVDNHIHCCPHINKRSTNVFEVIKKAEQLKMHAIGLMDNFSNTSGYASLVKKYLPKLKIKVFGGLIMEPPSGGVNYENAKISLSYSYFENDGAKFISFPTHHTRHVAKMEKRKKNYIKKCFYVPDSGPTNETLKILELIAKKNIVLNTGHLSAKETINLVKYAKKIGVKKILIPSNTFGVKTIAKLKKLKVKFEFSYFFVSKATNVPLTHVDGEKHKIQGTNRNLLKILIKTADPKNVILSSDCGVSILPKPHIGFLKFIDQIIKLGFSKKEIEYMIKINSKKLFNL